MRKYTGTGKSLLRPFLWQILLCAQNKAQDRFFEKGGRFGSWLVGIKWIGMGLTALLMLGGSSSWAQGDSVAVDSVRVAVSIAGNSSISDTMVAVAIGEQEDVQTDSAVTTSVPIVETPAQTDTASGVREQTTRQLSETASRVRNIFSLGNIFAAVFILIATYASVRLMTWLIGIGAARFGQYRLKLMMLIPIVRILMWAGAIYLVIAGVFSPSTDKLFAFAASAGLAIGFASQDVLKNIFGGLLIILDRPFQVGDKIQVGSHYGEVVNIGLRTVRIVTPDDSLVSIPNAELVNQSVSNSNAGALDCQVVTELFLSPDVDLGQAKKLAYEAAATSRFVYLNKPIVVMVQDAYDKGFLTKLKVKAYVLDTRYESAFSSDVAERAKAAFVEAGFYDINAVK